MMFGLSELLKMLFGYRIGHNNMKTDKSNGIKKDIAAMHRQLGRPLICVPIVDVDYDGVLSSCEAVKKEPADIVEWRIDFFEKCHDIEQVKYMLAEIKKCIGELPLICTFRTHHEGGGEIEISEYLELVKDIAAAGLIDYVDVEIKRFNKNEAKKIFENIRRDGTRVIASCHYFEYTPEDNEMSGIFEEMAEAGADVLKLAVMPSNRHDVIRLLGFTEKASGKYEQPIITMSMGKLGLVSRIAGELTGSVLTFATAGNASAPGQIPAKDMAAIFDIFDSDRDDF